MTSAGVLGILFFPRFAVSAGMGIGANITQDNKWVMGISSDSPSGLIKFIPSRGMMNAPQLAPLSSFTKDVKSGACCAVLGGCVPCYRAACCAVIPSTFTGWGITRRLPRIPFY
jgi:hypothetical protein